VTVASVRAREQITGIVGGQVVATTDASARKFSEFEARRLKDFILANLHRALSQSDPAIAGLMFDLFTRRIVLP